MHHNRSPLAKWFLQLQTAHVTRCVQRNSGKGRAVGNVCGPGLFRGDWNSGRICFCIHSVAGGHSIYNWSVPGMGCPHTWPPYFIDRNTRLNVYYRQGEGGSSSIWGRKYVQLLTTINTYRCTLPLSSSNYARHPQCYDARVTESGSENLARKPNNDKGVSTLMIKHKDLRGHH